METSTRNYPKLAGVIRQKEYAFAKERKLRKPPLAAPCFAPCVCLPHLSDVNMHISAGKQSIRITEQGNINGNHNQKQYQQENANDDDRPWFIALQVMY